MSSARSFLAFAVLLTACSDPADTTTGHASGEKAPLLRTYSGDIVMVRADNGDVFCEGQLFLSTKAGSLEGDGDCGDILLTVSGRVTDQGLIRGQIKPAIPNTPALSAGRISGSTDSDGLLIDWSLEIPMPDDPPLEDDIDMLTLDGEGWLSLDD